MESSAGLAGIDGDFAAGAAMKVTPGDGVCRGEVRGFAGGVDNLTGNIEDVRDAN
jgi:hypothetical protein